MGHGGHRAHDHGGYNAIDHTNMEAALMNTGKGMEDSPAGIEEFGAF